MGERIVSILRDENSASAREYGLIAAGIWIAIIIVLLSFTFIDVSSAITS